MSVFLAIIILHILTRVMPPGTKLNKNTAHICAFAVAKPWLQGKVYKNERFSMDVPGFHNHV